MLDGLRTKLGVDGIVPYGPVSSDTCCADPLCNTFCSMACSFIGLLPSGPMWDRAKQEAMAYYNGGSVSECETLCPPEFPCPTMVLHAVYTAAKLNSAIQDVLWPAIRESSPYTAAATLDDWLERFEWEDCHKTHCRSVLLGDLTPYEIMGECGPVSCPPDVPEELECAVKHGLLVALQRASRGFIKNLAGINFVIEPLGAVLRPRPSAPLIETVAVGLGATVDGVVIPVGGSPTSDGIQIGTQQQQGDNDECCNLGFEICNVGDTITACPAADGACYPTERQQVQAYVDRDCDAPAGTPERVWPAVITAECLVRSIIHRACPNIIHRCC